MFHSFNKSICLLTIFLKPSPFYCSPLQAYSNPNKHIHVLSCTDIFSPWVHVTFTCKNTNSNTNRHAITESNIVQFPSIYRYKRYITESSVKATSQSHLSTCTESTVHTNQATYTPTGTQLIITLSLPTHTRFPSSRTNRLGTITLRGMTTPNGNHSPPQQQKHSRKCGTLTCFSIHVLFS